MGCPTLIALMRVIFLFIHWFTNRTGVFDNKGILIKYNHIF